MTLRVRPAFFAAGVVLFIFFSLISSCSENPTDTTAFAPMEGAGRIDPGTGGDYLLSTVDMGPRLRGFVEVWAYNLAIESDSAVGFDLVLVNATNGAISPPLQFVITSIVPRTVECLNPDGYLRDRLPFFDFSDDMGDDGLLTSGEATAPVRVRFRWPEPTAFSIGFRIVTGELIERGVIAGVVFVDVDEDGVYDDGEPGIPGVPIEVRNVPSDSAAAGTAVLVRTDRLGRYAAGGLSAGVYRVEALVPPDAKLSTPNPLLVVLAALPDGTVGSFLHGHFGVILVAPPPLPVWVFGPVPVGPASAFGTRVDSTFVIPTPMPPFPPEGECYYVRVEAPIVRGSYPMFIDRIAVAIDDQIVYRFACPPDSSCRPPCANLQIDPALMGAGEHAISIEVLGSELSFVFVGIEKRPLRKAERE